MDKTKCNDKENEIFEKEREESCGLTFPVQHSGELFITFLSSFKTVGTKYRSSHQHLFNCCQCLGEHLKNVY